MNWFIKALAFCALFLLGAVELFGQLDRPYEWGELVLEDFQGEILDVDFGGQLYFEYRSRDSSVIIDGRTLEINYSEVGIDVSNSWLDVSGDFETALAYFQLLFDIEYLFAQKINALAFAAPFEYEGDDLQELQNEKNILLDKIQLESIDGQRLDIVEKWANRVSEDIDDTKLVLAEIELETSFTMSIHLGVGQVLHSSELNKNFGNSTGLAFGFDFVLKKYLLTMSGIMGFGALPDDLGAFPFWEEGTTRSNALLNIALGRTFDFRRLKLTPFIGTGLNNIFLNEEEYGGVYPSISESSWTLGGGLFLDIPIKMNIGGRGAYGYYRSDFYEEHGLRFAFHWTGENIIYENSGSSWGVSLNYYYSFGRLKQKNVESK